MQSNLLSFVLQGSAKLVKDDENFRKKQCIEEKRISNVKNTFMDSMYNIPEKSISYEQLLRHKRNLTMIPVDTSFSSQGPTPFNAYELKNGVFSVPRFYGIDHFGSPVKDKTKEGVEMIHHQFKGTLNEVQKDACEAMISRFSSQTKGGMLVLPCGYGKTVCAIYIACRMKRRTLVLVHKAFLVDQWKERAKAFVPGCTVGKIQQNIVDADADFVIGMIQSFSKREYPKEILEKFGQVIIDESHHMAAPVLHKALRQIPCRYIVSLSATPDRRDGLTNLLYWSMGTICYKIDRKPEHTLVSCVLYTGGKRKEILYRDGKISMALMLNALVSDVSRNEIIADRILSCYKNDRYIIVLTDRIKQLNMLHIMLNNKGIPFEDIGFYIGSTKNDDRELSSRKRIILSTYTMAKEGLDIPRLDTLVLGTPKGDIVQASGRIQRKNSEKKTPLIIDIVDTFSVFEQLRWKRWSFYRKELFQCQSYEVEENKFIPWYE